jgi:hypothetical protein
LTAEQEVEIIQSLRRRYQKRLDEAINRKSSNDEQNIRDCIELAEILEELYTKSNQKFNITTICQEIARDYKTKGVAQWHNVYDYLPEKYKNPRAVAGQKRRYAEMEAEISPLANLSNSPQIDSNNQLEQLKEQFDSIVEQIPNEQIRDFWELAGHLKEEIADKAEEAGVPLLSEGGYGSQTREDDGKVSTVEPPQTDEEVHNIIAGLRKDYHTTGDEAFDEFERFWPQHKDKVSRWAEGIKAVMSIFKWLNDDKFSLDIAEWFDRAGYTGGETEGGHGKHAGAVWRKALTCLCRKCSANVLEDEDEYEVMFIDPTSPTGWRCPKCHGHEQFERAMTREQIGDRREYIFGFANNLLQKIPGFLELCEWYREYKKPYNTARKVRLFRKLSDLA